MHLAIDIGNTRTKIGLAEPGSSSFGWTASFETPSADLSLVAQALTTALPDPAPQVTFAGIASVVSPELRQCFQLLLDTLTGGRVAILRTESTPWLPNRYETPETLGADRLANALALIEGNRRPAIAVDFGTATKLDAIDSEGVYLGGAILPGARMMIESLARGTAQLPEVAMQTPKRAIGRSTKECLESGTVLALAKGVEGLLAAFAEELGGTPGIMATGGLAELMTPLCPSISETRPLLTLEGLLSAIRHWTADSSTPT